MCTYGSIPQECHQPTVEIHLVLTLRSQGINVWFRDQFLLVIFNLDLLSFLWVRLQIPQKDARSVIHGMQR